MQSTKRLLVDNSSTSSTSSSNPSSVISRTPATVVLYMFNFMDVFSIAMWMRVSHHYKNLISQSFRWQPYLFQLYRPIHPFPIGVKNSEEKRTLNVEEEPPTYITIDASESKAQAISYSLYQRAANSRPYMHSFNLWKLESFLESKELTDQPWTQLYHAFVANETPDDEEERDDAVSRHLQKAIYSNDYQAMKYYLHLMRTDFSKFSEIFLQSDSALITHMTTYLEKAYHIYPNTELAIDIAALYDYNENFEKANHWCQSAIDLTPQQEWSEISIENLTLLSLMDGDEKEIYMTPLIKNFEEAPSAKTAFFLSILNQSHSSADEKNWLLKANKQCELSGDNTWKSKIELALGQYYTREERSLEQAKEHFLKALEHNEKQALQYLATVGLWKQEPHNFIKYAKLDFLEHGREESIASLARHIVNSDDEWWFDIEQVWWLQTYLSSSFDEDNKESAAILKKLFDEEKENRFIAKCAIASIAVLNPEILVNESKNENLEKLTIDKLKRVQKGDMRNYLSIGKSFGLINDSMIDKINDYLKKIPDPQPRSRF